MMLLFNILTVGFLLLFGNEGVSFGVYEVKRSFTPMGWAVVIIIPTALIFGAIYLFVRTFKKTKMK